MKVGVTDGETLWRLREKVVEAIVHSQNRHLPTDAWPRLAKFRGIPLNYSYHIVWDEPMQNILGVMVVESRSDNLEFFVAEIQSYVKGVGEILLKTMDDIKYPLVWWQKDQTMSGWLTRYYKKLALKYGWGTENVDGRRFFWIRQRFCVLRLPWEQKP